LEGGSRVCSARSVTRESVDGFAVKFFGANFWREKRCWRETAATATSDGERGGERGGDSEHDGAGL